jgi:hypothetical protein
MLSSSSIKDQASSLKVPSVIRLSTSDDVDLDLDLDEDRGTATTRNNTLSSYLPSHFREQQKYRSSSSLKKKSDSIRSRNTSSSYYNCTPSKSKAVAVAVAVAVAGDNNIIKTIKNNPSCNIVHRALEVMSKSLKDAATNGIDCQQQQQQQQQYGGGQYQQEAGQRPHQQQPEDSDSDDSGDDAPPSDKSKSDNDNPAPPTIVSSPSVRKIAKKRRKEAGRTSFHHTKSSKEYLRKAQEAYQRLHINEPEQRKQQQQQREKDQQELSVALDSDSDTDPIDYGYGDPDDVPSRSSTSSTEPINYGYGDPDDVPSRSSSTDPIDYGYGDPDAVVRQQPQEHQLSRRGGPARRRNSVTKFSEDAANIVAAKAATQRIMLLKPGLMSLARGISKTKDSNNNSNSNDNGCKARRAPPQRSRRHDRGVLSSRDPVVKRCSDLQQMAASQERQQDEDSSLMQTIQPSTRSYPLQLTSDYFNSDPKPNRVLRKNSNSSMNRSLRFTTPARTESLLSHDSSFGALSINNNNDDDDDDDDDANSLASDMESLCSIHDNSTYRPNNTNKSHTSTNFPPMPPALPPPSSLLLSSPLSSASASTSNHNTSLDHLSHYSSSRSSFCSDHTPTRKSLVISWNNSSNSKDGSFAHLPTDKIRRDSCDKKKTGKYPILPFPGTGRSEVALAAPTTTMPTLSKTSSQTCMPAPVRRTPSNNWQWQREE